MVIHCRENNPGVEIQIRDKPGAPSGIEGPVPDHAMLFFSVEFLYVFLPVAAVGYWLVARLTGGRRDLAIGWLIGASLVFYGLWNPLYLFLLGTSILVNYALGQYLQVKRSKAVLVLALAFNLGLLSWYKYLGFFAGIASAVSGQGFELTAVVLPLAISFFTFQQIAWVVDNYRGELLEGKVRFGEYVLFVVFFPQLIAGPIVHHSELIPQFRSGELLRFRSDHLATALAFFIIGMFKKVVLADNIAPMPATVFDGAAWGISYGFVDTWVAAIAYPLQVYLDFSAYGDMAIGLALLFNIRLPINFDSPHKSLQMVEYWRRWHMTLGRFMRGYVFIPLGGSRVGPLRNHFNVVVTLALAGLWHGAGWTFVIWGTAHGVLQAVYLLWRKHTKWRMPMLLAWLVTFFATTVAHSFFPAHNLESALLALEIMFMVSDTPVQAANTAGGTYLLILATFIGALLLPSTRLLMSDRYEPTTYDNNTVSASEALRIPVLDGLRLAFNTRWLMFLAAVGGTTLYLIFSTSSVQDFVYFQF
ncbi:MAG: MBOAT family O-acyltransferase [Pseudomonadota bacterium]